MYDVLVCDGDVSEYFQEDFGVEAVLYEGLSETEMICIINISLDNGKEIVIKNRN